MNEENFLSSKMLSSTLFESFLIYLACWCDDWKLSDFYEKKVKEEEKERIIEKRIISGYSNNYDTATNRIAALQKIGIPIVIERVHPRRPGLGNFVKVDRDKIIHDFIKDLALGKVKEKVLDVIQKAIPLIRIQMDYYCRRQSFSNEGLKNVIVSFLSLFESTSGTIKYFPLFLSFQPYINSEDAANSKEKLTLKWIQARSESQIAKYRIPQKILGYFYSKVPFFNEITISQDYDTSLVPHIFALAHRETSLDGSIEEFRELVKVNRGDIGYWFFDNDSKDFFFLNRLARESIEQKIGHLAIENREEWSRRLKIVRDVFFNFLISLLSIEEIDYDGILDLKLIGKQGKVGTRAPLKNYLTE